MKTIEQLLELTTNPYYSLTNEEQERLDAFLKTNEKPTSRQKANFNDSGESIPATVKADNVVKKHDPTVPSESAAVEDLVHPEAVGVARSILADKVVS